MDEQSACASSEFHEANLLKSSNLLKKQKLCTDNLQRAFSKTVKIRALPCLSVGYFILSMKEEAE